jgi:nitrogen fixation/metabolism regulation signal transduction histidine kinase
MAYSRFQTGILLRVAGLVASLAILGWLVAKTDWYVTILLVAAATVIQAVLLTRFATQSGREVARFLDAVAFGDNSASFSALSHDSAFAELGAAMARVLDQLRTGQAERAEQAQYLQTLISHVPVALISVDEEGSVQLLNLAARRLFESACADAGEFVRHGEAFATGLEALKPGESAIVRMERQSGPLQLKAAATGLTLSGVRRRLISLQNIETELSAQELAAWQTVIRVMAHEVTNSLTPITSLAATTRQIVQEVLSDLPQGDPHREALGDVQEALDTMARRSEGLLNFVQNHRRITRRMVAQVEIASLRRIFTRLQRLLAGELNGRNIELDVTVAPETLEIAADVELLDQALINLMRNAMEALRDENTGRISLSARQDGGGRIVISVADNGPGIAPDQREKVFVPFFTTKRQGSGVGLTLVRQIATVHSAAVTISETEGGGTTVSIRF